MSNKIHIMFPTEVEATMFKNPDPHNIEVCISGVGLCETGAFTARLVAEQNPRFMILAGIAGAYPDAGLHVGDTVAIGNETVSDQGAFRDGKFTSLYAKTYVCSHTDRQKSLRVVTGSSVNAAAADFPNFADCQVESMEGAAFFAVAIALGIPFLEVRAVSNLTTASRGEWKMELATQNLAQSLYKLIDEINA